MILTLIKKNHYRDILCIIKPVLLYGTWLQENHAHQKHHLWLVRQSTRKHRLCESMLANRWACPPRDLRWSNVYLNYLHVLDVWDEYCLNFSLPVLVSPLFSLSSSTVYQLFFHLSCRPNICPDALSCTWIWTPISSLCHWLPVLVSFFFSVSDVLMSFRSFIHPCVPSALCIPRPDIPSVLRAICPDIQCSLYFLPDVPTIFLTIGTRVPSVLNNQLSWCLFCSLFIVYSCSLLHQNGKLKENNKQTINNQKVPHPLKNNSNNIINNKLKLSLGADMFFFFFFFWRAVSFEKCGT